MDARSGCSRVFVGPVSENVGLGLFASEPMALGDELYLDKPLVSIQHTANRRFVKACQNCHMVIDSMRLQVTQILCEDRFREIDLQCLPENEDAYVTCDCGETYCSIQCGQEAYRKHHYCLCVATTGQFADAVSEFKFNCLSIEGCGDNLLLLSQLIATLASDARGSYSIFEKAIRDLLTYTNGSFESVARPPAGTERDTEWIEWLRTTVANSFELLANALRPQNEIFLEFFSQKADAFAVMSRLLALFELNNIDISFPSMLLRRFADLIDRGAPVAPILREKEVVMRLLWNDEARGIYEGDSLDCLVEGGDETMSNESSGDLEDDCHLNHAADVDELVDQIRTEISNLSLPDLMLCEFPEFHGTGFFTSVARTNHSCAPNVVMNFERGNYVVSCKALRDIAAHEELRMSYIGSINKLCLQARRALLQDYLFTCRCSHCSAEEPMM